MAIREWIKMVVPIDTASPIRILRSFFPFR
jgi:hypothetical protein